MSKTVDSRVVEMRFDNKNFESNVSTTMSSIDKLNQKLNLKGATKGLENVDAAAKSVNMTGLGTAVEGIQLRFSALEVMAVTALSNITNSAVNAGKRIASALTIDPIKTGLAEYETQINAVQTIMANTESKGTTLDDVNNALDELNTYADKTIYNFTEMTRNIGTFTAAGVDLDTSVNAIQGIANLAAVSGSTSQQASTAMYQLSQALASGTVKLMDWNSVVNAGMGGQVFQDALKETARVHGVSIDDMIEKNGSFRETLSEGWLTSEILTETLSKFTMTTEGLTEAEIKENREKWKSLGYTEDQIDAIFKLGNTATQAATKVKTLTQLWDTLKETAQSGWTQTWELILGDFEGAKGFFSGLYNTLSPLLESSAKARNELLQGWADAGGRDDLIDSLYNIIDAIGSLIKPIKEAFRDIFPATTSEQLVSFTKGLKEFTAKLKLSEETADKLKRTFKGVFAIFDIVKQVLVAIIKPIGALFGLTGDLGGGILSVTAAIGDFLVKVNEAIKKSKFFTTVFQGVAIAIEFVRGVISNFARWFKEQLIDPMFQACNVAGEMGSGVSSALEGIGSALKNCSLFKVLQSVWNGIKAIFSGISKALGSIAGGLFEKIGNGDFQGVLDFLNSLIAGGIGVGLMKFIKSLTGAVESFSGFGEGITEILGSVKDCFVAYQTQLKAGALLKIAGAVAILTAAILVLSLIDPDKLSTALAAITVLFIELIAALKVFTKMTDDLKGISKACFLMISMSLAILILASALKQIGDLNFGQLTTGLIGIAGLMGALTAAIIAMSKFAGTTENVFSINKKGLFSDKSKTQFMSIGLAMIAMAAAIKILASACTDLGGMEWDEIAKGLTGVVVLMGAVSGALIAVSKFIGGSEKLLKIDKNGLFNSKSQKNLISIGLAMIGMAAAVKILASACKDLSRMDWDDLSKGLTGVVVLMAAVSGALIAVSKFIGGAEKSFKITKDGIFGTKGQTQLISIGLTLLAMAAALKILASVCSDLASLSWGELAKGLVGITVMLGVLVGASIALSKFSAKAMSGAVAMLAMGAALKIVASACADIGSMSWGELVKGLVGMTAGLAAMVAALIVMSKCNKGAISGAAAILVVAMALRVLTPVLTTLGSMSWGSIAKGLITLASAIGIVGAAAALLNYLGIVPAMLGLAGALALIGVAAFTFGSGLVLIGAGLSALAVGFTAIFSSLGVICAGIISLVSSVIVGICKGIAEGIVAFCDIIIDGIPAIGEALKVTVLALCDVLVECAPVIADTILKIVVSLLDSLVKYGPTIIDRLFDFIIVILNGIADRTPDLIQAVVNIFMSLFSGVLDALGNIDFATLVKGMGGIGIIAGVIAALSAITPLIPGAMAGVLGMGAVISELALVLGAIGMLANIPGLTWLVDEGAELMASIGEAIGGFVGSIVGGLAEGITSTLPQIGQNLSDFMTNAQPFIDGIKKVDASVSEGVKTLVGVVLSLTGANIVSGLTSWLTGGSSLVKFGEELAEFGPYFRSYADSIAGVNPAVVMASAMAAEALVKMTHAIPNEGGVVSWFTGENSISKFGSELPILGAGLKGFSDSVAGIVPENIKAAADAALAISKMTSTIPNEGGMVAWFTGDNSIAKFGLQLPMLGAGLKGFSDSVAGIVPENIISAADAAKSLAEMASVVPNEGGMVAWFTGDNSLSKFGEDLKQLGVGLKGFSDSVSGIVPENLTAAISAAKALAEMSNTIPNEGGMVTWFTGDNSLSKFGSNLIDLGMGLKGFSVAVTGIVPENVVAAANAAKSIAEMASNIPNEGGIATWFTGDNSLSKFANQFPALGYGLKGFSDSLTGIIPENIIAGANAAKSIAEMASVIPNEGGVKAWFTGENSIARFGASLISLGLGLKGFAIATTGIVPESITAAAGAAKSLAEMANVIPNEGGVKAWFTGESSISKFGAELTSLGMGLKGFAIATVGIVPESITAAAGAAKSLADMTAILPNEGGVKSWFAGETSISKFGAELINLGMGLKGFAVATVGIVPENVTAAANAAKSLAEMANVIPSEGGIKAWFTGESSISTFADQLPTLGAGLKGFSESVAGISPENVTAAANAAKSLAEMTNTVPDSTDKIVYFGDDINEFGDSLKSYFSKTADISGDAISGSKQVIDAVKEVSSLSPGNIQSVTNAIDDLVDSIKGLSKIKSDVASNFKKALKDIGESGADALLKAFDGLDGDMKKIGKEAIEAFIKGIESKASAAKKACKNLADDCADAIEDKKSTFKTAGKNLVQGFANGISSNQYSAVAKAKAMAKAAAEAAKKALGIESPSKVFYEIGGYSGEGFTNALDDYARKSYAAGSEMAGSAKSGLSDAIKKIGDVVSGDIDAQPTIRPVLDLSDVESGASLIGGMFGSNPSVGVLAKVGAISSLMHGYNQNGTNDELVSAIDALRKDLDKVGNTSYNINGVTYDDGSNISEAVKSIVRAARVERRT